LEGFDSNQNEKTIKKISDNQINRVVCMRNNKFLSSCKAQAMVEYILLIMLIAIVALGAFAAFGRSVENKTNDANTEISNIG